MNLRVRVNKPIWTDSFEFLIGGFDERRKYISVADPVTMHEHAEGDLIEPTFRLAKEEAQSLMDDLWHNGLRPTEGTGSAGSLKATQDHLGDMRKIAFQLLEKK